VIEWVGDLFSLANTTKNERLGVDFSDEALVWFHSLQERASCRRLPEEIGRRVFAAAVVIHNRVELDVVRRDLEFVRRVAVVLTRDNKFLHAASRSTIRIRRRSS